MPEKVQIEKLNELYVRIHGEPSTKMELQEYFTFEVPGAKFMPAYRNKVWDGKIRLLNAMTGKVYTGLVPYIHKFCKSRDYHVEHINNVVDEQQVNSDAGYQLAEEFDASYKPRDYQNDAIVHALKYNRSL